MKHNMPHPVASVHAKPPGSVIVSGVESGGERAHMDTSSALHYLQTSDRSKSDCQLSTFVVPPPNTA